MFPTRFPLLAIALLAATTLAGCSPAQSLVGKWQLDTAKVKEQAQAAAGNNPLVAMATAALPFMQVEMEFKGDGNFLMSSSALGQQASEAGSWRYVKTDGDLLVLMLKLKNATSEREVRVRMLDGQHLEMAPPSSTGVSDKTLPFVRTKTT